MSVIRVLIADDHLLFREGLNALLFAIPDIEVVGEAATGEEAVARARELQPDVILMDINMPVLNGVEATRTILQDEPKVGIIMVTMLEDNASVFAAMRAGARGYVLKGADHVEMLQAIRAVANGQALFGSGVAARFIDFFQNPAAAPTPSRPDETFPELTVREREVLGLIARGFNNAKIAQELVISPKTVRNHITSIFSKLQVADRAQAIIRAREAGLQ